MFECQDSASVSFGISLFIELEKDLSKAKRAGEILNHHARVHRLMELFKKWMKKHENLSNEDLVPEKYCWPRPRETPQTQELLEFLKTFDITYGISTSPGTECFSF